MTSTPIVAAGPHDPALTRLPPRPSFVARTGAHPASSGLPSRRIHGDLDLNAARRLVLILAETEQNGQARDGSSDVAGLLVTYDHEGTRDVAVVLHDPLASGPADAPSDATGPERLPLSAETLDGYRDRLHLVVTHGCPKRESRAARSIPLLRDLPWSCSRTDVDWRRFGLADTRLEAILSGAGLRTDLSRPSGFCGGLLTAMDADTWPRFVEPPFAQLLTRLASRRVRVHVLGPTYGHRDALKLRGFRWSDGRGRIPRGWFLLAPRSSAVQEIAWINWRLGPDGVVASIDESGG